MTGLRSFLGFGIILVCMAYSAAVFPAQLDNLFDAAVPVLDKESVNREAGLRAALVAVLVKLTGDRAIADHPAIAGLLGRGQSLLQRYAYEERELPPDPDDVFGQPVREILLHAWFDAAALQRAVRTAGLPLWGRERPTTLVWLAVENDGNRLLVSNSLDQDQALSPATNDRVNPVIVINNSINAAVSRRGITLQFPLLDAEDKAQVDFADVWGGFSERILGASTRYDAYGVLVGNIYFTGDERWSARWTLIAGSSETRWQVVADSLAAAIDSGIDGVADLYGRQFAIDSAVAGPARLFVEVQNVATLAEYAQVLDYLDNLSMVQAISVQRVFDGKLALDIRVIGDAANLEQAVRLGSTLVPIATIELEIEIDSTGLVPPDRVLKYRLVP